MPNPVKKVPIPGPNPDLMKENTPVVRKNLAELLKRPVYGRSWEREVAKADEYNKRNGLPYRMSRWNTKVPLVVSRPVSKPSKFSAFTVHYADKDLPSSGYFPWRSRIGIQPIRGMTGPEAMKEEVYAPHFTTEGDKAFVKAMGYPTKALQDKNRKRDLVGKLLLGGSGRDSVWRRYRDALSHEGSHYVTSDKKGIRSTLLGFELMRSRPFADLRSVVPREILSPPFKGREQKMMTYPEMDAAEIIPPLNSLQEWMWRSRNRRLESPEEYDKYIEGIESLLERRPKEVSREERLEDLMEWFGMPPETRRFFRYRERMRQDPDRRRGLERLKWYDGVNRRLVPGITRNGDRPRSLRDVLSERRRA